jgi:SH3-like domain-containing protein
MEHSFGVRAGVFISGVALCLAAVTFSQERVRAAGDSAESRDDDVVVTARQSNYVREGPGSYHKVVVVVKKETPLAVLERKGGWIHVRLPDDRKGWISKTSVREGQSREAVTTEDIAEEWASTEATQTGVAAAVRGFQMHADGLEEGSVEALMAYLRDTPTLTEDDLEHFRRPLRSADRADLDVGDLDLDLEPYDPSVEERQVGMAVATRLVSKGLVRAPRVQRYLMLLTEQLTAETPYYDRNFDVVIIEGAGPDAFACPGGTIFITRGIFTHFGTEAQLAGLLAHEIAHVVRHHGMAERSEREVKRKSQSAFAELEQATGDDSEKYEQVEEDLAAMMRKSYRRVVNDRLLKYEKEADRIAAVFLSEAGYSAMGIVRAVENIATLRTNDPDLFDEDYLSAKNIQERLRRVEQFVEENGGNEGEGLRLERRFEAYKNELR